MTRPVIQLSEIGLKHIDGIFYHQTSMDIAKNILNNGFVIFSGGNQRFSEGIYFLSHSNGHYGNVTLSAHILGNFVDFSVDEWGDAWNEAKDLYMTRNYTELTENLKKIYSNVDGLFFGNVLVVWNLDSISDVKIYDTTSMNTTVVESTMNKSLKFLTFLNDIKQVDPILIESIHNAYTLLETITEPMIHLKRSVNYIDADLVSKLSDYIKYSGKSSQEVTSLLELVTREWSWFGEAINERWGDGQLELGDDYPYDIDYDNLDIDGLIKFMNEEPRSFEYILRYFQTNIEGNNTSQLMDYEKPLVNKWFVHFTNHADSILRDGFKYGNEDITKLALTDAGSLKGKNYGDYLFAYDMNDVEKYAQSRDRRNKFKYGDSAIIFIGSGIKFYHHGDLEPQVVFDKKSPSGCFIIKKEDPDGDDTRNDKYVVYGKKNGRKYPLASKETFYDAMYWCRDHYNQYKKFYNW